MQRRSFGIAAAAVAANLLAQSALAQGTTPAPQAEVKGGKCVHNCAGYATCKGNGNNSCRGRNDCANTGLVPKDCSSKKDEKSCKEVLDKKKNTMCSWYAK